MEEKGGMEGEGSDMLRGGGFIREGNLLRRPVSGEATKRKSC